MQITVYTSFSKRKNSTKVPTGGTVVNNVELKNNTSIHSPTFILGSITGVTMNNIRYVKAFDEYYYVTDISVTPHNYWEITCVCDPMASHKSEILGSTQYVMYSASMFYEYVPDTRLPQDVGVTEVLHEFTGTFYSDNGFYVLTCLSNGDDGRGTEFVTNYMITPGDLAKLADDMLTFTWSGAKIMQLVQKPFDSIISLRYIPLDWTEVQTQLNLLNNQAVTIGDSSMSHTNGLLFDNATNIYTKDFDMNMSWHYQDFRLADPYTQADIYIPGYGVTGINPLHAEAQIKLRVNVDVVSGDVTFYLYGRNAINDNFVLLSTINYNISVQIPIAQIGVNATGTISSIMSGVGAGVGLATGAVGKVVGLGALAASGVSAAVNMIGRTASVKGAIAGKSWLHSPDICIIERYSHTKPIDSMNTTHGRPVFNEVLLSGLSGYCQCANASVSINGFDSDRDYINNTLNSGFYIE